MGSHRSEKLPRACSKRQRTSSGPETAAGVRGGLEQALPLSAVPADLQDPEGDLTLEVCNIGTRAEAVEMIRHLALDMLHSPRGGPFDNAPQASSLEQPPTQHASRSQRMLLGWDFSLGFPAGFAQALGQSLAGGQGRANEPQHALPDQAGSSSHTVTSALCAGDKGPLLEGTADPQLVPPWRVPWEYLSRHIEDRPDNSNNRFQVAARINQKVCGPWYLCDVP